MERVLDLGEGMLPVLLDGEGGDGWMVYDARGFSPSRSVPYPSSVRELSVLDLSISGSSSQSSEGRLDRPVGDKERRLGVEG